MQQYVDHSYNDYGMVDDDELRRIDENADAELLPAPPGSNVAIAREKLSGMRCTYGPSKKNLGGVAQPFPCKLLDLLDGSDFSDLIDWMPHGRAFLVKKPKSFATHILPRYFKQSKFISFTRQLNLWGFKRITRGIDVGAYYHELFLRGRPYLAMRMKRQKIKGTGMKLIPNPEAEPNFYEDWPVVPELTPSDQRSKNTSAELSTASLQSTATPRVNWLELQQIISLQPIIHNSFNADRFNILLQEHHHLQQQLQQHPALAAAGRIRIGQQSENPNVAENSSEAVDTSSIKDPVYGHHDVLNSAKLVAESAASVVGKAGLSTFTTATANDSPCASSLPSPNDIAHQSSAQETNHHHPTLQRQPLFHQDMCRPGHHNPAMSYDNILQSFSTTNLGGMSLFDCASRYRFLEQHNASLVDNHQGGDNTGEGRVGGEAALHPNGSVRHDKLATMIQSISRYQALTAQDSSVLYPPLHQQLSSSDRLLVMERLHDLERAQQRGVHGDHLQDNLLRARLCDDFASSNTTRRATPSSHHGGGNTTTDLIHAYHHHHHHHHHHHRALGFATNNNPGSPHPRTHSYPAVGEVTQPSTKTISSPPGSEHSSALSNDDGPRRDQLGARNRNDPEVSSSVMDSLLAASHLEVLALAQCSKARSLVLADALQSRSGEIVGAMPTSELEKNPFVLNQTENKEKAITPSFEATVSLQKKWPSLGRPFGRKAL